MPQADPTRAMLPAGPAVRRVLSAPFFRRPALEVAPQLLGMHLCVRLAAGPLAPGAANPSAPANPDGPTAASPRGRARVHALRVTEVEAYIGPEDLACHASKGRTVRTEPMFAPGGVWYVYLIYGMYEMLNIVTGPRDFPAAILLRGLEGHSGPGRLTRALGIDRRFNARPATRATGLWFERRDPPPDPALIRVTPRIGVDYAGPDWAARPYRFLLGR